MKKILLTLLLCFSLSLYSFGQLYNPYVDSGSISPSPMAFAQQGGSAMFSFVFGNDGTADIDFTINQEMKINVSLIRGIPNRTNPAQAVSGPMAHYFTWTYDAFGQTMVGTQNKTIPTNTSGLITIDYRATSNSTAASPQNGFNINIVPSPQVNGINNLSDDNTSQFSYTQNIGLPVKIISFTGQKFAGFNKLYWSTATELNSDHFNLYHGKSNTKMDKLVSVKSKATNGYSDKKLSYSYDHEEPLIGDNYYRLASVDKDGSEDFHNTISIYVSENSSLTISPNPTANDITVTYTNGELDLVNLILTDVQGKTIYKKKIIFDNGTFTESVPMDTLPAGTYLLNITNYEGYSYSQKIIKE